MLVSVLFSGLGHYGFGPDIVFFVLFCLYSSFCLGLACGLICWLVIDLIYLCFWFFVFFCFGLDLGFGLCLCPSPVLGH